jgi:glycosyltransferase involved in cell wall biosynthesis
MNRLLFVVNVDWFFVSHRLPVALAARDAGYEVHIATVLTAPKEHIERYGLTVHSLALDRKSVNPLSSLGLLITIYNLIRRIDPSAVHLVTIKPVLIGGLAARLAGVQRVVASISGLGFVFTAKGIKAVFQRSLVSTLYRFALGGERVRVIFQNGDDEALLKRYARLSDNQVIRIRGSGVDVAQWPCFPSPAEPPVVLMASRLLIDKGVYEFVTAARLLRGYRGVRFVLVGSPDEGNPTSLPQDQVLSWVNEGCIEWWGHRQDMPQVLAAAHVVVLPSYREGLPKVLIEAAASGRAVVTTDVPGCRDAIEPGQTGLLVPVRDGEALARSIRELLDDPERRRTMGATGRVLAEHAFDVREVVAKHLAIYQE